jgi:hypothetical protein
MTVTTVALVVAVTLLAVMLVGVGVGVKVTRKQANPNTKIEESLESTTEMTWDNDVEIYTEIDRPDSNMSHLA